eukprot:3694341-Rhodomonas_salina.3
MLQRSRYWRNVGPSGTACPALTWCMAPVRNNTGLLNAEGGQTLGSPLFQGGRGPVQDLLCPRPSVRSRAPITPGSCPPTRAIRGAEVACGGMRLAVVRWRVMLRYHPTRTRCDLWY